MQEFEKPLSIEEAAAFLGLKKSFVYKLTSRGQLSFYKPTGGRLYFQMADLKAFIFRNRRAADYELNAEADRREAAR